MKDRDIIKRIEQIFRVRETYGDHIAFTELKAWREELKSIIISRLKTNLVDENFPNTSLS